MATNRDEAIPIQPVENPILCSPYKEPDQHWLYDTRTGIPSKTPGRRPASYWFKTERTGSGQMSLLAEEERGHEGMDGLLAREAPSGSGAIMDWIPKRRTSEAICLVLAFEFRPPSQFGCDPYQVRGWCFKRARADGSGIIIPPDQQPMNHKTG